MKLLPVSLAIAMVLLTGCMPHHGPMGPGGPTTLGRQLMDLKAAHDHGALTDQEFTDAKAMELKLLADHENFMGGGCGCGSEGKKCGCGDGKKSCGDGHSCGGSGHHCGK